MSRRRQRPFISPHQERRRVQVLEKRSVIRRERRVAVNRVRADQVEGRGADATLHEVANVLVTGRLDVCASDLQDQLVGISLVDAELTNRPTFDAADSRDRQEPTFDEATGVTNLGLHQ